MKSHTVCTVGPTVRGLQGSVSYLFVGVLEKPPDFDPETLERFGGLSSS